MLANERNNIARQKAEGTHSPKMGIFAASAYSNNTSMLPNMAEVSRRIGHAYTKNVSLKESQSQNAEKQHDTVGQNND